MEERGCSCPLHGREHGCTRARKSRRSPANPTAQTSPTGARMGTSQQNWSSWLPGRTMLKGEGDPRHGGYVLSTELMEASKQRPLPLNSTSEFSSCGKHSAAGFWLQGPSQKSPTVCPWEPRPQVKPGDESQSQSGGGGRCWPTAHPSLGLHWLLGTHF